MTFEPYSPPVDVEQAPRVQQPQREAVLHRMFWSLGCAALSCVSIVAMVCLVEWHDSGDPMMIGDAFPFVKVVIPLGIAGMVASLAFLFSVPVFLFSVPVFLSGVPVFLSGRIMPAIWLLPLVLFILWFFTFYDWRGLFDSGKPRYDLLEYRMSLTWEIFRYGDGRAMVFCFVAIVIASIWMRLDTDRTAARDAARDAATFDQIVAGEIASCQPRSSEPGHGI